MRLKTVMTTKTTNRPAVRVSARLAPYAGPRLRFRMEVTSAAQGALCGEWHDTRRAAIRAGRKWARERGYRVESEA